MTEITVMARVLASICLVADIALFWLAMRHRWRTTYFVWLVIFGVFSVIEQWVTGLMWWLSVLSCFVCAVAMIIVMIKEVQRIRRQQAAINAERQRVLDEIAQQHEELMRAVQAVRISEEINNDQ